MKPVVPSSSGEQSTYVFVIQLCREARGLFPWSTDSGRDRPAADRAVRVVAQRLYVVANIEGTLLGLLS